MARPAVKDCTGNKQASFIDKHVLRRQEYLKDTELSCLGVLKVSKRFELYSSIIRAFKSKIVEEGDRGWVELI